MGNVSSCCSSKTSNEEEPTASEEDAVIIPAPEENNNVEGADISNLAQIQAFQNYMGLYRALGPTAFHSELRSPFNIPQAPMAELGRTSSLILEGPLPSNQRSASGPSTPIPSRHFTRNRPDLQDHIRDMENLGHYDMPGAWSPRPNNALAHRHQVIHPYDPFQQNPPSHPVEMIVSSCEESSAVSSVGAAPASSSSDVNSSAGISIRCPVCLDGFPRITSTGRSLMSTVCGHIFCSRCLPVCIRTNGRCPTCRNVLFLPYDLHPIFI